MRFDLSETQQLLQKTAREFLANECPMAEVRRIAGTPDAHDPQLWKKMAAHGLTGMMIAEEHGGMALGFVEMAAIFEQMGRALLPGPFHSTVALAGPILQACGAHKLLPPIAEGDAVATVALLEDSADPSPASWCFDGAGRKLFVPDANAANFALVAGKLDGDLTLFLAPRPSYAATPLKALDLTRRLYQVDFHGKLEPLARGPAAEQALEHGLQVATVALAAEMLGGMQRLLDLTIAYAKTRKQFDKPIGSFQAVQQMCADMLLWSEGSRAAVYYAAYALDRKLPEAASAISVAKIYAADAYRECGNRAIQIHGGMGFTWESDLHLYYRRAKACENALGDTAWHRERLASLLVDRT